MIVHEPVMARENGRTRISARIETTRRPLGVDHLWFDVDDAHGIALSARADPFLVAVMPLAMALQERLEIRGPVSPRLAWGLREWQAIQATWWPAFPPVHVTLEALVPAPERAGGVALAFSGGVDSLASLWRHTGGREPLPRFTVTHAMMVNGFDLDVDLAGTGRFDALRRIYAPLLEPLGVQLVEVRTNLRALRLAAIGGDRVIHSFATAIAAASMTASPAVGRLYLAGAVGYADLYPEGSHPLADHLLSTEGFDTIHDGADVPARFDKIAIVAAWPEALQRLRVCSNPGWSNVDVASGTVANCGRCDKCVRTMTSLALLGCDTGPTFREALTPAKIRMGARTSALRGRENLREAVRRGRTDIAWSLRLGLLERRLPRRLREILRSIERRRPPAGRPR